MKVLVAQKGAREHYAVARALHQRGMLAALVTDWYAPKWGRQNQNQSEAKNGCAPAKSRAFPPRHIGRMAQSALAARCDGLPDSLVRSFPLRSVYWKWKIRAAARKGAIYDGYADTDAAFAHAVTRMQLPKHDVFFGYSYASLEILAWEKQRGVFTVLDQIDPGPAEYHLVAEEMARYPDIAGHPSPLPQNHFERARREWELADLIVVNSDWSKEAIISEGAPKEKIEIIPLCYEKQEDHGLDQAKPFEAPGQLRVLFLGQVNMRKGIHHLIEAARLLTGEPVKFLVAGRPDLRPEVLARAPKNIHWLGSIPRGQVSDIYSQSDVFVLPTLSDGFAITQLEAMAHGLPVITTPHCGQVVENGLNGFIVPAGDFQGLANAILRFIKSRELAPMMRPHCKETARKYSLNHFQHRLVDAISKFKEMRPALMAAN